MTGDGKNETDLLVCDIEVFGVDPAIVIEIKSILNVREIIEESYPSSLPQSLERVSRS